MGHVRRWGAIWILLALFLGSWIVQFFNQLDEVTQSAKEHHQMFLWADFWPQFLSATMENWQSEFLQLLVQALLVASMWGQPRFFRADYSADKEDVDKILVAISRLRGHETH